MDWETLYCPNVKCQYYGKPFGRQEFLNLFCASNPHLVVCAICDESGFITKSETNVVRSEIDHYLPKAVYPHLAVHPYNLIPVFHFCNAVEKGSTEPLKSAKGPRRELQTILLPYRAESRLSKQLYLRINLQSHPFEGAKIVSFGSQDSQLANQLQEPIEVLAEVYNLPRRWNNRVDTIGEQLFRRLRDFWIVFEAPELKDLLVNELDKIPEQAIDRWFNFFIGNLDEKKMGKDPYAFAMVWWIITILQSHHQMLPLLIKNIQSPGNPIEQTPTQFIDRGKELRQVLADRSNTKS
ncbi:MAG: hypothetical protein JXA33_26055 [Anaerolineae bacterium]|nr:hypothetical protein [Anaerolineae bacterium]